MKDKNGKDVALQDCEASEVTGVQIGTLGHKLWVCIDGQAILRVKSPLIELTDLREHGIRFSNKRNPLGLQLGDNITVRRTCTVQYDEDNNRKLFFDMIQRSGVVVGCVKRALGTYLPATGFDTPIVGDYDPPRLSVSSYVWLYEIKTDINAKPMLVMPDDVVLPEGE